MRTRWLAVLLLSASPVRADQPVELPPLLTPAVPAAPVPAPRGPVGTYDHGYLYLPEAAPPAAPRPLPPREARPLDAWWLNASFELGWASRDTPLPTLRLRVPGVRNGPVLPLEGVSPDSFRLGFDVNGGAWFDEGGRNGLDVGGYLLASGSQKVTGVAPGVLLIFPDGPSRSAPQVLAFPEPLAGGFYSTFPATHSSMFTTVDVNYRRGLVRGSNVRLDALVGYRYGYVADELIVGEAPRQTSDDGTYLDRYDNPRFAVTNHFHGGQVGLAGELRAGAWSVGGAAKVAFGAVTSELSESGLFTRPEVFTGTGFLPRSGVGGESRFAVLPTLTTTLGRHFGNDCRVFVGYSFYHLGRVGRLGDVLAAAGGEVQYSDFWAQSVKFGLEIRY